jgi:cytochrome c oxidase subunit III
MSVPITDRDFRVVPPAERKPAVPNEVIGTMILILTEIMFFAGIVSALEIARASVGMWPPPGQPRLPVELTAVTTGVLLASGAMTWFAGRRAKTGGLTKSVVPMAIAIALGTAFVTVQGWEWVNLVAEGLTLTTSTHSAFFYFIVGTHAIHAVIGLVVLLLAGLQLRRTGTGAEAKWTPLAMATLAGVSGASMMLGIVGFAVLNALELYAMTLGGILVLPVFQFMALVGALTCAVAMLLRSIGVDRGVLEASAFQAIRLYWYFVCGLWPILYWQVYL